MRTPFNSVALPLALVVDDEALIRLDVADMLEDMGFAVHEADCVKSALAFLEKNGDDVRLLVTDVQMPGSRNGATLANHVSFVWPDIQIVVTSGAMRPAIGQLPLSAQFLAKPLTPNVLQAHIVAP